MDILQSSSAAPLAPREAANAPAQQAGGSFQGERVHYVSVSQSLADAAEELTFAFSERAEKSLAKRRLSDAHARLSEVQAMLQEYWKRIPDLESQQKLEALIAHLGSGQLSSLAQLSAYLEGFSSEVSQRFLALSRARKQWLAGHLQMRGTLVLDDGAVKAVSQDHKSLLPVGVKAVQGSFRRGEMVVCVDQGGREVARGLVNYSALEAQKILGQPTDAIEALLGYVDGPELVHRDNLVLV
ncbi:type III secretion system gatekeeper subunit SctW [Pseudomonas aeruginosa]|nr:type III secretion system gatekeeper subunit SctW [Pseudomonas aeruginosa]